MAKSQIVKKKKKKIIRRTQYSWFVEKIKKNRKCNRKRRKDGIR